jgi:hypothetical protein
MACANAAEDTRLHSNNTRRKLMSAGAHTLGMRFLATIQARLVVFARRTCLG